MFLMFLLCSSLIWFLNNLSETYTSNATFNLIFDNVPDSLLLTKTSKKQVDVKIQATGFQFLGFNFRNKEVKIDVASISRSKGRYFIPESVYRKQIVKQLRSMVLEDIDRDTLYFEFTRLGTKVVPVHSKLKVTLAQNHMLDGPLLIEPNEVTINGPIHALDTIKWVNTVPLDLFEIAADFSTELALSKSGNADHIVYSNNTVNVRGKVTRFSEKMVNVSIQVINLPQRYAIRTFPEVVAVLCKGALDELKELKSTDFEVVADYNSIKDNASKTIALQLVKKPENLQSAELIETQVEYILKRQ